MSSEGAFARSRPATAGAGPQGESGPPAPLGLLTPAAFWTPDSLVESAWYEHAPFAFWLIDAHRPRGFVELGTHNGFSYLAFCQAIDRLGVDARAYAVDHWRGDEHAGYFGDEVLEQLRTYHDPRYGRFSQLLQSSFDDAAPNFADESIDLLHIDGAHRLESVQNDFETWLPKMSARGVMIFHDINVRRDNFGVWELWERVSQLYPHFAFDHGYGLGVLGVGRESRESLGALFALTDGPDAEAVKQAFARLGAAVTETALLEQARHQLAENNQRITGLLLAAHELEKRAEDAEARASEAVQDASESANRAAAYEQTASALQAQVEDLARRLSAVHASRSWRLTAPLRAVGRQVRRIGGLRRTSDR